MKNGLILITFLLAAAAAPLLALPSMPAGFRCIIRDNSGKTWRETGELAMAQDAALAEVRKAMLSQGYKERFAIGGDGNSVRILLWVKGDEEIIVSLWKKDESLTGCSWGLSAKTPPAVPSGGGKESLQPEQGTTTNKENNNGKK